MNPLKTLAIALALFMSLAAPASAQRCCLNLGDDPETQRLAVGIRQGAAVLIAVPYALVGCTVLWVYIRRKRERQAGTAAAAQVQATARRSPTGYSGGSPQSPGEGGSMDSTRRRAKRGVPWHFSSAQLRNYTRFVGQFAPPRPRFRRFSRFGAARLLR